MAPKMQIKDSKEKNVECDNFILAVESFFSWLNHHRRKKIPHLFMTCFFLNDLLWKLLAKIIDTVFQLALHVIGVLNDGTFCIFATFN